MHFCKTLIQIHSFLKQNTGDFVIQANKCKSIGCCCCCRNCCGRLRDEVCGHAFDTFNVCHFVKFHSIVKSLEHWIATRTGRQTCRCTLPPSRSCLLSFFVSVRISSSLQVFPTNARMLHNAAIYMPDPVGLSNEDNTHCL